MGKKLIDWSVYACIVALIANLSLAVGEYVAIANCVNFTECDEITCLYLGTLDTPQYHSCAQFAAKTAYNVISPSPLGGSPTAPSPTVSTTFKMNCNIGCGVTCNPHTNSTLLDVHEGACGTGCGNPMSWSRHFCGTLGSGTPVEGSWK
jgi:hypothetical protein